MYIIEKKSFKEAATYMNTTPIVSIIMPCWNSGEYIEESIQSALAQNYPALELIIVDDGSTDAATISLLDSLHHPLIKILRENHAGPSHARNRGIEAASGTYILPLDSDDLIEPAYVSRCVEVLEQQPRVGMVYCQADSFGHVHGPVLLPEFSPGLELYKNVIFNAAMFRKLDWQRTDGYDESLTMALEDWDFWLSLLELGLTPYQLPEVYFHYRIHGQTRGHQPCDIKQWQDIHSYIYTKHSELYRKYMPDFCTAVAQNMTKTSSLQGEFTAFSLLLAQHHALHILSDGAYARYIPREFDTYPLADKDGNVSLVTLAEKIRTSPGLCVLLTDYYDTIASRLHSLAGLQAGVDFYDGRRLFWLFR